MYDKDDSIAKTYQPLTLALTVNNVFLFYSGELRTICRQKSIKDN